MEFHPVGTPVLVEDASTPGRQVTRQSGIFQNFLKQNANKRTYPKGIWEGLFKDGSDFMNRIKNRAMLGLLEHPEDGVTRLDRLPSHLIVEVHFATPQEINETRNDKHPIEEGDIVGTLEVLGTSTGKELLALIEAGVLFGVSSRGGGSLREDGDGYIVENDFECETWDVVAVPSVQRATPHVTTRTTEAAPAPAKPVVIEDDGKSKPLSQRSHEAINMYVQEINHARKTRDANKLEQSKAALIKFMQRIGLDYRKNPEVLDAVTESVVVQSDVDGSIIDTFDDEAKAKAWLDAHHKSGKDSHGMLKIRSVATRKAFESEAPNTLTAFYYPSSEASKVAGAVHHLKGLFRYMGARSSQDRSKNAVFFYLANHFHTPDDLIALAKEKGVTLTAGKSYEQVPQFVESDTISASPTPKLTESTKPSMKTIRDLQIELTQLRATPLKGMKPTDRANIIEAVLQMQVNLGKILIEDASQKPLADRLGKHLNEFMDDLDEPEAVDATPAAPAAEGDEEGGEGNETIQAAADKLRELAPEDEAVTELADELEALSDECAPVDDDSAPVEGEPVAETIKRLRRKLATESAKRTRVESTLSKLSKASAKLVERHNAVLARVKTLEESGGKDGEAMKAARELATRYNRDMIEFASLQLQRTRPALAEANAAALRACKTWNSYSALVESLIKAEAKKPKRPVTEAAPAPGTKPAPKARPALTEAVANHPSLRMATRHRSVTA